MGRAFAWSSLVLAAFAVQAQAGLVFTKDGKAVNETTEAPEFEPLGNAEERPVPSRPRMTEETVARPVTENPIQIENRRPVSRPTTRTYAPARRSMAAQTGDAVPDEVVTPQGKPNGKKPKAFSNIEHEDRSAGATRVNAAFPFTHLLPSPVNLPAGTWQIGTTVAVGVTDFLQVSTNVVRDGFRYWNLSAKVPLIEFPTFIASAFIHRDTFNLNNFDAGNPDLRVTTWQPGLVTGYEIDDDMAFFVGGNFNATSVHIPDGRTSGYSHGAQLEVDWSYLYNPVSSRLKDNAISAGANYDFTYKLWGIGLTHHWPTFDVGFHYTVNADNYRFLPIFAFSTGFTF